MNETVSVVMSWFVLVLGLSYLIQSAQWAKLAKEATGNTHQYYPMGLFVLLTGLVIVTTHNTWSMGVQVIITILGWIMVIKSALYLVITPITKTFRIWTEQKMGMSVRVTGAVLTLLGAMLVYQNTIAA